MSTPTDRYRDLGLLILRVGIGIMFLFHGLPKLTGGPAFWGQLGMATNFLGIGFAPAFWGFKENSSSISPSIRISTSGAELAMKLRT